MQVSPAAQVHNSKMKRKKNGGKGKSEEEKKEAKRKEKRKKKMRGRQTAKGRERNRGYLETPLPSLIAVPNVTLLLANSLPQDPCSSPRLSFFPFFDAVLSSS